MSAQPTFDQAPAIGLYERLISAWNQRDAQAFADCFHSNGNAVGFDGTQMDGVDQIRKSLKEVFDHHPTASYVTIVREVRNVGGDTLLLRAVAGMVPPNAKMIKPDVNAIQSLVAHRTGNDLKITLFQNTPAQFHGRPEAVESLTKELQSAFDQRQGKR
jgi:uncharacterized protein (TIGR02246 family)